MAAGEAIVVGLAIVFVAIAVLTVLFALAQAALGLFVLQRGDRRPGARFLGGYLLLQLFTVGLAGLTANIAAPGFDFPGLLALVADPPGAAFHLAVGLLWCFLPPALVAFSLTYPTPSARIRAEPMLLFVPFVPSVLGAGGVLIATLGRGAAGLAVGQQVVGSIAFTLQVVGTLVAALVFARRAKRAQTGIERRRLRYMQRVLAIPLAIFSAPFMILALFGGTFAASSPVVFVGALLVFILALAGIVFIPAAGMPYGLLRYKILDLDRRARTSVRFTLTSGMVSGSLLVVFFLATESAQQLLESRAEGFVGSLIAAIVVAVVAAPLQQAAAALARRVVPAVTAPEAAAQRAAEVYRATFDEMLADGELSDRDRRILALLAAQLGLPGAVQRAIEDEIVTERGALHGAAVAATAATAAA